MSNPYYIPRNESPSRFAELALKMLEMKSQYDLGESKLAEQAKGNEISAGQLEVSKGQLAATQESNRIKLEGPEVPVYKRPFKPNTVLQKTSTFINAFPEDMRPQIKKTITPIYQKMKDFSVAGEATNLDAAEHFQRAWPTIKDEVETNLEKIIADKSNDEMWMTSKEGEAINNLYNMVAADKTGEGMKQLLFGPTLQSFDQESRMKEAEIAQKSREGEPKLYETTQGYQPADKAKGLMKPTESTAPADLKEFEMRTYGKEVPEKRGTVEYKDAQLAYMKQKRDATTAPNKTEPKILRQEFINQSKTFVEVRDSYNRIKESVKKPSAAGDLSLIFNYMKMLDPGSVVRESEFATAAAAGSYGERIKAAVDQAMSGKKLSDEMRNDFAGRADMLYEQQQGSHDKLKKEYDRLSKELGVEPSQVIIDYVTEQKKIQGGQFDVGEIYRDASGKKARYKGKDATGKDQWEPVE